MAYTRRCRGKGLVPFAIFIQKTLLESFRKGMQVETKECEEGTTHFSVERITKGEPFLSKNGQ